MVDDSNSNISNTTNTLGPQRPMSAASFVPPGFARSLGVKFFLVGFLTVALTVPLFAVWLLTMDRADTQRRAITEIGAQWGREQVLTGPFVAVKATKLVVENTNNGGQRQQRVATTLLFPPDTYDVAMDIEPQTRRRGIFEAVVYSADVKTGAQFDNIQSRELPPGIVAVDWDSARLVTALTDMKGIENVETMLAGRAVADPVPGTAITSLPGYAGFHHPLDADDVDGPFAVDQTLRFRGSAGLQVSPVGADTRVSMVSSWPHPSFSGKFLPSSREISDTGFRSSWQIPQLARQIPPVIDVSARGMARFLFESEVLGARLYQPVDYYRLVDRAVKYGVLFVSAAFLVVFIIEVLSGKRMHIVHYAMTGLMVVVFYVLLLALAERLGFAYAYAIASGATGGVIAAFTASVFNGRAWTLMAVGGFTALYGLLFVILSMEDFALLAGAISAFVVLTGVMFATRDTDWSGRNTVTDTAPPAPSAN
ncbi:MAG: cell envelope integrity protein CreD [Pseudomonadota bacterium]